MKNLGIQLINYKTKKYLEKCLEDITKDLSRCDLIYGINVLDNNSGDKLDELEEKYRNKEINFYCSKKNLGFGGGHNFLAKKSNSKYILILNPDIRFIEEKTIQRIYSKIDNDKNIKIIGPKLLTEKHKSQRWDHGQLKGILAKIALRSGNAYWSNLNKFSEVAWISGAFFMIERNTYDKVKGFDEKFFLYKEEEDLCLRIREIGGKVWYFPEVKVMHIGSVVAKKSDYMDISQKYFDEKHLKEKTGFWFFRMLNWIIFKTYKLFGKVS